jgi:steroid delta-isomerase-like uncharacterized protein
MSVEANKAVVRGWVNDVLNGHDIAAIETYFTPDCIYHDVEMGDGQGIEAEKQLTIPFINAFPDLHFTLHRMLAEGDLVAAQATCTGTHTGELMGQPPTGKRFEASFMILCQLVNGKIAEHWANDDIMHQFRMLGILPAAAPA